MAIHMNHTIIIPEHQVHGRVQISVLSRDENGVAQIVRVSDVGHSPPSYVQLYGEAIGEFIKALTIMKEAQVLDRR